MTQAPSLGTTATFSRSNIGDSSPATGSRGRRTAYCRDRPPESAPVDVLVGAFKQPFNRPQCDLVEREDSRAESVLAYTNRQSLVASFAVRPPPREDLGDLYILVPGIPKESLAKSRERCGKVATSP